MATVTHSIRLHSSQHFEGKLPPRHLGLLLAELPSAVSASVSMAFRRRSVVGRRPLWLQRAADIRFADYDGDDSTVLYFEAAQFEDVASELWEQPMLFPELDDRPSPDDTAFDLLGDVLSDVAHRNSDSTRFDPPLLKRIIRLRNVFHGGPWSRIDLSSRRFPPQQSAHISPEILESASQLLGSTPAPQRVRIVGQLDALIASTQRFTLVLDGGERVSGVFAEDQIEAMQALWRQRVLVLGKAIYRASGRLLRIDADEVRSGEGEASIFSRLPGTPSARIDLSKLRKPQGPRSGINAIIGHWPGDETDEEISHALEELS